MKSWKRWAVAALVTLALALGLGRALHKRQLQQKAAAEAAAVAATPPALELGERDLFSAQALELEQGVAFTGTLKALRSATLKARVAGELQGLAVREGDTVRAGDVLARVDPTESQARVRQAEQQANASRAQLAIAQRQHDNNLVLVKQDFISPTATETSAANLDGARANLEAAQAALEIARKALADTVLRAPIAGQVAARLAQNGERVAVDGRILDIVDPAAMEIEAALPPASALELRVGQAADWEVEGMAQPARARIARIAPSVQAGSRSVMVYLAVPPDGGLRQGLFVQGRIVTGRTRAVAVPLSALRSDKPSPYLQILRDGKVQHLAATLGAQGRASGEDMVAVEGLEAGAIVLRASAGAVADGTAVKRAGAR
ncbi:MAG: Macrolide export protein MacA [Pseudomonadota bacterium]|jgi:RND family efflux transporter MFP subunit